MECKIAFLFTAWCLAEQNIEFDPAVFAEVHVAENTSAWIDVRVLHENPYVWVLPGM